MLKFLRARTSEFLPRSQSRDASNDADRAAVVIGSIEAALEGIDRERAGLRDRYEAAQTNASMYIQAADGEGATRGMQDRLLELEKSVIYYEKRMAELADQSAQMNALREAAQTVLSMSAGE